MEDIQLFNSISIKSSVRDYTVFFENDYYSRLLKDYVEGDLIVVDSRVSQLYPYIILRFPNSLIIDSS